MRPEIDEVGDSLDLLLGPLAALGYCQPDGTFITTPADLRRWLGEMAAAGEAVCLDGLATRVQRPQGWANQRVLYDPKRHSHTAQGLAISTIHGDVLWVDGDWPGSCHEHELIDLAGLDQALDDVEVASLLDRGFRGLAKTREHWYAPVGDRRTIDRLSQGQRPTTACRRGCARWWSSRSPTWQAPGRCAAGAGCCTASGTSSALPARWSASAAGCTGSPHDKSITDTLLDILEAIERIDRYAVRGREAFEHDELIQSWITHQLQIIGEAAARITPDLRENHPRCLAPDHRDAQCPHLWLLRDRPRHRLVGG